MSIHLHLRRTMDVPHPPDLLREAAYPDELEDRRPHGEGDSKLLATGTAISCRFEEARPLTFTPARAIRARQHRPTDVTPYLDRVDLTLGDGMRTRYEAAGARVAERRAAEGAAAD